MALKLRIVRANHLGADQARPERVKWRRGRRLARRSPVTSVSVPLAWVTAPPLDGRANDAVLEAVAKELGVRVGALRLRSGARSRTKVIEVTV